VPVVEGDQVSEQPLDSRAALRAVWRQRVLLGVFAVLGLAGGTGYAVCSHATPSASALVVLPPNEATPLPGNESPYTLTQIIIATSTPVLAAAGRAVSPPLGAAALRGQVVATALNQDVLRIRVSADRVGEAERLADAVASAYVAYVTSIHIGAGPTELLQRATVTPASSLGGVLEVLIGAGAGLLVGCSAALIRSRTDRRLRSRDAIASAIGVPVLASIEAERCRLTEDWRRLVDGYQPTSAELWSVRRMLRCLGRTDGEDSREVSVFAFASDGPALAAGAKLAIIARCLGLRSALLVGQEAALAPLRAALVALDQGHEPVARDAEHRPDVTDLEMSLVAVDEAEPRVPGPCGAAVLAVSSGFATGEVLARVALAACDAGSHIDAVLVVNADCSDSTTGSPPDGRSPRPMALRPSRGAATDRSVMSPQ
jgi:hypothetical protein